MTTVLDSVESYIRDYIYLEDERQYKLLAVWTLHTWTWEECAQTTPYLYLHSPEPGSGKTMTMDVLSSITRNPVVTADITAPTLTRLMDSEHPTLYFDELDTIFASKSSVNKQLQGVINSGYKRGGKAYRTAGQGIKAFDVFGPKCLAGIHNGFMPDTIISRTIPVTLRRKRSNIKKLPYYAALVGNRAEAILNEIEEWSEAFSDDIRDFGLVSIPGLNDRESEILWPLLAIANLFGNEVTNTVIGVARDNINEYKDNLAAQDKTLSLFKSIAEAFYLLDTTKIHTAELLDYLEMDKTKGAKDLASLLDPYGIDSVSVRRGTKVAKGYKLDQFAPEFEAVGLLDESGALAL